MTRTRKTIVRRMVRAGCSHALSREVVRLIPNDGSLMWVLHETSRHGARWDDNSVLFDWVNGQTVEPNESKRDTWGARLFGDPRPQRGRFQRAT